MEPTAKGTTTHSSGTVRPVYFELLIIFAFLAVAFLYLPQIGLHSRIPNGGDITGLCYPQLHFLGTELRSGHFPLWNPHIFSGTPFFANPHTGSAHLPHLILFTLFPPEKAFPLDITLHFFLAGWFTYLLIRLYRVSRPAAFTTGLAFMFSQFVITKVLITAQFFSLPFLPLMLYGIERVYSRRNFNSVIIAGIATTLLLLCGYPQTIYITAITVATYIIFRSLFLLIKLEIRTSVKSGPAIIGSSLIGIFLIDLLIWAYLFFTPEIALPPFIPKLAVWTGIITIIYLSIIRIQKMSFHGRELVQTCLYLCVSLLIGVGLAAIQLVPALIYQAQTIRASFPVSDIIRVVEFSVIGPQVFRDLFLGGGMGGFTISGYIGTIPIFIIMAALLCPAKYTANRHPAYLYLILLIVSFAIAFDERLLFNYLFLKIPRYTTFFVLHRYLLVFSLALSVLFGFAFEKLIRWKNEPEPQPYKYIHFFFIILGIAITLGCMGIHSVWLRFLPGTLLLSLFLLSPGKMMHPWIFITGTMALLLIELTPGIARYQNEFRYLSPGFIYPQNQVTDYFDQDSSYFRYYSIERSDYPQPATWEPRFNRLLLPNSASVYDYQDVQGYDPIYKTIYRDYIDRANRGQNQRDPYNDTPHYAIINPSESRLISLLNVKYIASEIPLGVTTYRDVTPGNGPERIYYNTEYFPRALLYHRIRVSRDINETYRWMDDPNTDLRKTLILQENAGRLIEQKSASIGKTGKLFPANHSIRVRSAAPGNGDMVQFWVEDKELLDSTEGYVLAVLQPDNGDFEKLQTFRTDQSPDECQRLIETLESIDTGRIVIAAGRGKALQYFKPETWAAFKSIGGTGKPALAGAQAIIGIQGTLPGQAMENETKPFIELSIPFAVPVEYQYDVARRYDENSQLIEEKVDTTLDSAKVIRYYPNRIGLKTYSPIAGFLLLSEIYDRGWRVKIDDIPGKIYPADGIFRAVYLNPGRHTLEFDYWPDGLTAGILITLLTGILLVLAVGIRINILLRQRAQEKLEEELIHKAK